MAALLRNGHGRVFEYGYSFVKVCAKELEEHEEKQMFNTAVSMRVARTNDEGWKTFMESYTKKAKKAEKDAPVKQKKKQQTLEEHRAIARRLVGI